MEHLDVLCIRHADIETWLVRAAAGRRHERHPCVIEGRRAYQVAAVPTIDQVIPGAAEQRE